MYPRPVEVQVLGGYRLAITFEDGVSAELDFRPMTEWGGVYEALKDPAQFGGVRVDAEAESLTWPGDVDLCPDVLYHLATGAALPGALPRAAATRVRSSRVLDQMPA